MASSSSSSSSSTFSGSPPPPPPDQALPDPDHVNLRIIYLVTGNPRPPHHLGRLDLNTTVLVLKEKIQSELPEHPSPSEQRLIYQGRPLLRNDANLREILRIEHGVVPDTLPYTIHIVIQPQQNPSQPQASSNPILNPPPPPPIHLHHGHADLTGPLRAAENSANRLQESLVRIQQQIEANRAELRSVQHRIAVQHTSLGTPPTLLNGQVAVTGPVLPAPHPQTLFVNPLVNHGFDNQAPTQRRPAGVQAHLRFQPHAIPTLPPQQPGTVPLGQPRLNGVELHGPNGEHMMVVASEQMSFVLPVNGIGPGGPGSGTGQQPAAQSQPQPNPTTQAPQNGIPLPMQTPYVPPANLLSSMPLPPIHVPVSFAQNRPSPPRVPDPTAWLLWSPAGPEGFLFAPGHGLFTSEPPSQSQQAGGVTNFPSQTNGTNRTGASHQAEANNQGRPNAIRAIVRANQPQPDLPQPGAAVAQAQQNGEDNDLFAFIINRGWLFLRLYLFMFVFSEPGTWKRWIMIFVAAVVCLQPRDGPLTRLLAAARRHLDNLIGPPPPQPPPEAATQRRDPAADTFRTAVTAQRPANVRGATTMTPQEARARLEEQQNPEPRPWRDMLYRVEQSVALFLASLIPGVGERHVRAREEARREEQRRVEERGRVENESAAQRQNGDEAETSASETHAASAEPTKPEVTMGGPGEQSTSTSVQVRDGEAESGELRNRT
ncbi:hypothetical protein AYL99_01101 [Fonsecaea erecta]|uniref:Ubiquitin-like domain-containing protein n=1 Tax=Fonsecaea erecta TaxID=1367422 RepID=A0A178ZZ89_9EURO|nr:hypothetical protein AYL99_01101 [Fonsecaea erecta]OAP65129.1 hypothetical protein AYL99_01101 [Fonsecaea erecta]